MTNQCDKFWVPLQERAIDYEFGRGRPLWVFGRLRDGVSFEEAQAELTAIGRRIAADHPDTHANLRPDLMPYAHHITDLRANFERTYPAYAISLLLLAVACGNVGTLMLARASTRSNEIAVRTALGASRARIVGVLFVESLVLATLAAAVGLVLAQMAVSRLPGLQFFQRLMPFWFDLGVKPFTVAVAGGLAVFSAVIAGLLPALKATGKRACQTLQRQSAGGSGLRFGAVATVLIVAEAAIAVGGLAGVSAVARSSFRDPSVGDIAEEEYLTTELTGGELAPDAGRGCDRDDDDRSARLRRSHAPGAQNPAGAGVEGALRPGAGWPAVSRP